MKLTKYEHACVVLEEGDQKLVIDPGSFTPTFGKPKKIAAVVITHIHADHFDPGHIDTIVKHNPDVQIFTTAGVAEKLSEVAAIVVEPDSEATVGPFTLRFLGELHRLIHPSLPRPQNTGVMVNDIFFYPGDSFTPPDRQVRVLAVPGNAPWASVGESMDYIAAVKPQLCFPTHDGLLADNGHLVYNASLEHICKAHNVAFRFLRPGESMDI